MFLFVWIARTEEFQCTL